MRECDNEVKGRYIIKYGYTVINRHRLTVEILKLIMEKRIGNRSLAIKIHNHTRKIAPSFLPIMILAPKIVTLRNTIAHPPSALAI